MYQVFEGSINKKTKRVKLLPAAHPYQRIHFSWVEYKFETLQEAKDYTIKYLGIYSEGLPTESLGVGKPHFFHRIDDIEIFLLILEISIPSI